MQGVGEDPEMVEILTRRNEAEREGGSDHRAALRRQRKRAKRPHALDVTIAKAAFEQLGRQRRRADVAQAGVRLGGNRHCFLSLDEAACDCV
jgi:hypothetical protein